MARSDVDVNLKDNSGSTALWLAIEEFNLTEVQILLSHANIDVNVESCEGRTPLIHAVSFDDGYGSIAKHLLAHHNINVNCMARDGRTALAVAAKHGDRAMVQLSLTRTEIDTNSVDKVGYTPLSLAVYGWFDELPSRELARKYTIVIDDFKKHEAVAKLLLTRTDVDIECIDDQRNNLLSRVTKYAREASEPRFEGTIAHLRAAKEDRSKAFCGDQGSNS